ncbi:dystroglycan-related [Anaeramoeba flamelloides]|uniref:Dystroglycan-related n=1 Tax=Anaeramoeba flamelloides TaxID=1746091 RepID=A0ABQ8YZV6_9EUKA|nr:dystroglycan-related [Anaeramoeba flamelloides]
MSVSSDCLTKEGDQFHVNYGTALDQTNIQVELLSGKQQIYVFESDSLDGDGSGIFFRMFQSDGTLLTIDEDFQVNTNTVGDQTQPRIAVFDNDDFIIVWQSTHTGSSKIMMRRFDQDGVPIDADDIVVTGGTDVYTEPCVVILADLNNRFIISWSETDVSSNKTSVYAKVLEKNLDVIRSNFEVSTQNEDDRYSHMAALEYGTWIIVWEEVEVDQSDVMGRIFDSWGFPLTDAERINKEKGDSQMSPQVASFYRGTQYIVFFESEVDSSGVDIYFRIFDRFGNSKTAVDRRANVYSPNDQLDPKIEILTDDRFIITWSSVDQDDPGQSNQGIYSRIFDPEGYPISGDTLINTDVNGDQKRPSMKSFESQLYVAWESDHDSVGDEGFGIYAQLLQLYNSPSVQYSLEDQTAYSTDHFEYIYTEGSFLGSYLTLEATLSNNQPLPGWLDFWSSERKSNGTVPSQCDEDIEIKVSATDLCDEEIYDTFLLSIFNRDPIENRKVSDQSLNSNTETIVEIASDTFTDPEGDDLTLESMFASGESLPDWIQFSSNNYQYNISVPPDQCSDKWEIKIRATDTCDNVVETEWYLSLINNAPTANKPLVDQRVDANTELSYIFDEESFLDPEGVLLQYTALKSDDSLLPDWLTFEDQNRKFVGTPPAGNCDEYFDVKVTAIDCCDQKVEDVFRISIDNLHPYTNNPLVDQIANSTHDFEYIFEEDSFIDHENIALEYSAYLDDDSLLPDWLNFEKSERRFYGAVPNQCNENIRVKVYVRDNCEQETLDAYTLSIQNLHPYLNEELADHQLTEKAEFEIIIPDDAFIDPENNTLEYSAKLINGDDENLPNWLDFDPQTKTFSGETEKTESDEEYIIEVTATDNCQNSFASQFKINIEGNPVEKKSNTGSIVGGVLGGTAFIALIVGGVVLVRKKKGNGKITSDDDDVDEDNVDEDDEKDSEL